MKISHSIANSTMTTAQTIPTTSPLIRRDMATDIKTEPEHALLTTAQQQLAQLADIDQTKVESIKNAIKAGQVKIDTVALSAAILKFHHN